MARQRLEEQQRGEDAPTSTTNMTGFRIMWRGSSLRNESTTAPRTIGRSNSGRALARELIGRHLAEEHEVLDDRPQREARDVGQCAHDHDGPDQQSDKQGRVRSHGPRARRHCFFAASDPATARAGTATQ